METIDGLTVLHILAFVAGEMVILPFFIISYYYTLYSPFSWCLQCHWCLIHFLDVINVNIIPQFALSFSLL